MWPWMQGIEVAVADPIDPVTPEDTRPSVKALITENRDKIDKIKAALVLDPLYDASKHDDLWILRFWLSHKKSKKAISAAKHALEFRKQYDLDSKDIRHIPPQDSKEPQVAEYWEKRCRKFAILCFLPDKQRAPVMFIQMSKMDPTSVKEISEEAWDRAFIYSSEWAFQNLDYITRTTGRLTRSVRFIELTGISLFTHNDRASTQRDGKIMGKMEDVYPQLLETLYACNPPDWVHLLWVIARHVLPQRVLNKVDIIAPKKNEKERERLLKHISFKNLPDVYGGSNVKMLEPWKHPY